MMMTVLTLVLWRAGIWAYDEEKEIKGLETLKKTLETLERHLGSRGAMKWLETEDKLSLGDLSLASALTAGFKYVIDKEMREMFPKVTEWYLRTIGSEVVKDVFGEPVLIDVRKAHPDV